MATAINKPTVTRPVPAEVPDERVYETKELADVDRKICDAIDAAEAVGNGFLTRLLDLQVGTHYYETR